MKTKLHLRLATRVQDARLLDMLRIPDNIRTVKGEWHAVWWSHGTTKEMRSVDREQILGKIAGDGVNELELKWRPEAPSANAPLLVLDLWASLRPAWTSALWAPVPKSKLALRQDERNRKSFGGGMLPDYSKFRRPQISSLDWLFTLAFEKNPSDAQLQDRACDWLSTALGEVCESLNPFGSGWLNETNKVMLGGVNSMGGVPEWTDQLGEKFDNIYPIMIGPVASCEGLASILGSRCSLIHISDRAPTAIVSIPPDNVDEIRKDEAVKKWIVIRDLSKLDAPAATLDEIYRKDMVIPWLAPFVKR